MAFATINKPSNYFDTKLYTGNDSTQTITGVGFQPDLWWNKSRSGTHSAGVHCLYDSVRGTTKRLKSNSTDAEATISGVTAFNADGVTLGSENQSNGGSTEYVAWNWKANGAGVSNTAGTISSTVSANTTSGFSIVSYTGTGANATIGHGIGVAPKMVICKTRNTSADWYVYHASMGTNKNIYLNTTGASTTSNLWWNNTAPTSTVFSVGDQTGNNGSGEPIIAYCFAEVKGYSKFGSYTGNGSTDGTFVYTGFKPAFIIVKNTTTAGNGWAMFDNKRLGYNVSNLALFPSDSSSETSGTSYIDILSNGFKMRSTNDFNNKSGDTYIYMAFAEQPLVGTNNVPATAR